MPHDNQILVEDANQLRESRTSVKWRTHDADVLPLWVAEMDAVPAQAVVEAVRAAVGRGDTGYHPRNPPYATALAEFAGDRWGWDLPVDRSAPVADVMSGVAALLRRATDRGGPVVVSTPVYDAFGLFIDSVDRRMVDAPLTGAGRLDLAGIERTFAELSSDGDRVAYLLCSPQNPTGTVHTADELEQLARVAEAYDVTVVADEIHAPLVHPGTTFVPYLTADRTGRGHSVLSASKGWNLAGLKAALVVSGEAHRTPPLHAATTHGASHLGLIAQTAALREGRDWLDQLLREVADRHAQAAEALAPVGVRHEPPPSTYLAWLDLRDHDLGDDPAVKLRREARVALGGGPQYGRTGFARLNVATSREVLAEALTRICDRLGDGAPGGSNREK
ncbi:aminotransferase class I/II-fold pyridoxal phosphate-dependent enzyme [Nocardioidaceae bacterium]|nr:aminotransferase class I/II-fold pyridoxal phosphate-dependent enzyme [Nocardioidaceae bacterium]